MVKNSLKSIVRKFLKIPLFILVVVAIYMAVSLVLTFITVDRKHQNSKKEHSIFLTTNGLHLDVVLPKENVSKELLEGLVVTDATKYIAFGWGDEGFYVNTPTWADLTFKTAFNALFLKSSSAVHVSRFRNIQNDWVNIQVDTEELKKLNVYLSNTFKLDVLGKKSLLKSNGYSTTDNFYKSKGSYSCFKTCNTWMNKGFQYAGLEACYWTPFDFGLLHRYE